MTKRKTLEELTLADDFMFSKVMGQPELAKSFLEELFQKQITSIERHVTQSTHDGDYIARSVRFDVEFIGDGVVHDIEMQQSGGKGVSSLRDLLRRTRYYQSCIDRAYLEKGARWHDLPDSKVILICTYDPFGEGLSEYRQVSCLQCSNRVLDTGAEIVYLNAAYILPNSRRSIREFLDYIRDPRYIYVAQSNWVKAMHNAVCAAKKSPESRRELMSLEDLIYGERLEAHEEAARNLARNLKVSIEEARKLLQPNAAAATEDDAGVSMDMHSVSPAEVSGVQHMNLGGDCSKYLGGIYTGNPRMDLANRLRWCRSRCGMLKTVILNNLGVSEETLDAWESGQAVPSDTALIILADLYRVKVDDLVLQ